MKTNFYFNIQTIAKHLLSKRNRLYNKSFIFVLVASLSFLSSYAQFVSMDRAKNVALSFYNENLPSVKKQSLPVKIQSESVDYENSVPAFYAFNINSGGFVIVSADERIKPVLGYSTEGSFSKNDISDCMEWLLKQYKEQIYEVVSQNLSIESSEVAQEWVKYETNTFAKSNAEILIVGPYTTTTWSQGCYYNQECPADPSLGTTRCGRVPTGCVATAFAQIMKYYNYPSSGVGSISYTNAPYGTISANFAATTYNWSAMPNKLTANNKDAATLLYHCGVSINMDYGPTGSSAYSSDVRKALVNTFKYSSSAQYKSKISYSATQWDNLLKAELDAQRIVLINGQDTAAHAGHGFVCDGYQNTNYFHINWGWNGSCDGYFYLNALNPSSYAFNSSVGAIIGIKPSVTPSSCSGTTTLTAASGSFSDGSGTSSYNNNLSCKWLIKPANAGSVTLNFTSFSTQANYDKVRIYSGETTSSTLLATYSGGAIPASVTSNTGKMLVYFTTNGSTTSSGWDANYTSAPPTTYCSGTTTLTPSSGTFNDGSGSNNYSNYSDCYWLITPAGAETVKLTFTSFNTESNYDKLYVYDGITTSDPLLGTYSGSSIPPATTANSGKMLVRFVSDVSTVKSGWSAKYTSQSSFCTGTTTITNSTGTISDGSGSNDYKDNSNCKWIIKPSNASSVKLSFTSFDTESNYDIVKIYNGTTTSSPLLGSYSGSSIPASVTANSGKMLICFTSDYLITKPGWDANFTSTFKAGETSIDEFAIDESDIEIIPNPNFGDFRILLPETNGKMAIRIIDIVGNVVYKNEIPASEQQNELPISLNIAKGLYFMVIENNSSIISKKFIITNKN